MGGMDDIREALTKSTVLWRSGQPQRALRLLDEVIAEASRRGEVGWARALSRHAAVICGFTGDHSSSKRYSEQAVTLGPDDPMALYRLAKVLSEQGEVDLARQYAARSYELSLRGGTELDRARIELITQRWPDLASDADTGP